MDRGTWIQWTPGKAATLIFGVGGVILVGVVDWVTSTEISLSIAYLLPISFSAWFGGKTLGLAVSVFAAATWLALEFAGGLVYSSHWIPLWNGLVRLGFFAITTLLLNRVRLLTSNLDAMVAARTRALEAEVKRRKDLER